jgi:predicted nucleotidyltransferase
MESRTYALLRRIEGALRAVHGERLKGVVMYGSEADGTARDDSDVDVLVLLEGPIRYADDLLANLDALRVIGAGLGRRISPKPVDAELYEVDDCPLIRSAREAGVRA